MDMVNDNELQSHTARANIELSPISDKEVLELKGRFTALPIVVNFFYIEKVLSGYQGA